MVSIGMLSAYSWRCSDSPISYPSVQAPYPCPLGMPSLISSCLSSHSGVISAKFSLSPMPGLHLCHVSRSFLNSNTHFLKTSLEWDRAIVSAFSSSYQMQQITTILGTVTPEGSQLNGQEQTAADSTLWENDRVLSGRLCLPWLKALSRIFTGISWGTLL